MVNDALQVCHPCLLSPLPPGLGVGTPWLKEWHWHFVPTCGAGISDTLGMEAAGASPLSAMAHSWVVA